jgi:hypothetical protein
MKFPAVISLFLLAVSQFARELLAMTVNALPSWVCVDRIFVACRSKVVSGEFVDGELIELAKALGAPMVELFPARAQAVLRGQK